MSGSRRIFISESLKVYRVSQSKGHKGIIELANQTVLEVFFYYETFERKPSNLLAINFDRLKLDSNGQYHFTDEEMAKKTRNLIIFGLFQTAEDLSKGSSPLPIPTAPVIPTRSEKEIILKYMKEKFPKLYVNGCYILEQQIRKLNERYDLDKKMVKEASELRYKVKREPVE